MSAPKNNQFWKQRSKHGRDKIFADPEKLWSAACAYFEWCDEHPWTKYEVIKSGELAGKLIAIPVQRPYTLGGLVIFLGVNEAFWRHFKSGLNSNKNLSRRAQEDFCPVITRVEEVMRTQKFEGAAVGVFNANLIARDLGLVDRNDTTTNGESFNKAFGDFLKVVSKSEECHRS